MIKTGEDLKKMDYFPFTSDPYPLRGMDLPSKSFNLP